MLLPTVILPGFFASASEYFQLEGALNRQGIPAITVPLRKRDWIPTLGGRSMVPILKQIDRSVRYMLHQHNASKVNLIAHSAGGWIARIYLGEIPYDIHADVIAREAVWSAHARVDTLVTLGTPHISQERWTRLNLDFVKANYPGAFYPHVRYICVAGKAIYGQRRWGSWLAYNSYRLTCGKGECWGDGITPLEAAHLEGATNLTLEGVMHSPRARGIWYGSPEIIPAWLSYVC